MRDIGTAYDHYLAAEVEQRFADDDNHPDDCDCLDCYRERLDRETAAWESEIAKGDNDDA